MQTLKTLSIQQPYTAFILNPSWFTSYGLPSKDVENRDWYTSLRERIFLHAGKKPDDSFYNDRLGRYFLTSSPVMRSLFPGSNEEERKHNFSAFCTQECHTGGIVGMATLHSVVQRSESPWFRGKFGFVLTDVMRLPFMPYRGYPSLFDVPIDDVVEYIKFRCFCCGRLTYKDESTVGPACSCATKYCKHCSHCEAHCLCRKVNATTKSDTATLQRVSRNIAYYDDLLTDVG